MRFSLRDLVAMLALVLTGYLAWQTWRLLGLTGWPLLVQDVVLLVGTLKIIELIGHWHLQR